MTLKLLLLVLCASDPVAEAGSAYRQALQSLHLEKYEEAVQHLRDAIQKLGDESNDLKYRDGVARRRHEYYPYYEWGRARLFQSKQEPSVFTRRDLLKEALSRISQTKHPDAGARADEIRAELDVVEKAIALDGSFSSAKTRIEVLGTGERFEEALTQADAAAKMFVSRQKELGELRTSLKERQTALEARYEQILAQRLGDVAITDPIAAGDTIAGILKPAQIPPEAVAKPGSPFVWLRKFLDLWEKQADTVRRSADLSAEEANAAAAAFEEVGLEAFDARVPAGFRAARQIAHAVRMAKLARIAAGGEDVFDTAAAARVVAAATLRAKRAEEVVARFPDEDASAKTLKNDVPSRQKQVDEISDKIAAGSKERARLTAPIVLAEQALADGDTLGNAAALVKVKNDLFELESDAAFGTLTARLRARALMAHAIAEATLAFLEGDSAPQVVERCRLPAWRAYGFDRQIEARWKGKLSPKMAKVLDQIKPQ